MRVYNPRSRVYIIPSSRTIWSKHRAGPWEFSMRDKQDRELQCLVAGPATRREGHRGQPGLPTGDRHCAFSPGATSSPLLGSRSSLGPGWSLRHSSLLIIKQTPFWLELALGGRGSLQPELQVTQGKGNTNTQMSILPK